MRHGLLVLGLVLLAGVLSGCMRTQMRPVMAMNPFQNALAITPVVPPQGWIYQEIQAPLSVDFKGAKTTKVGTASTRYISIWPIAGFLSFGLDNASLEAAIKNGGLKDVAFADYRMFNVLGVYSEFTVKAYGN